MAFFLIIVHALLLWLWIKPDEKTGRNASVWCLVCYWSEREQFFIGTFESADSKYLDKLSVLGSLFINYYSLRAHTSCWEYLLPTTDATTEKKTKNQKIKKTKTRNSGRFFLALLYCRSFSLDIRSFSSLFFTENKLKRSILNRKWAYSLLWQQPFASALVRPLQSWLFVPPQDSICRWRRKGRWMSAFWC